MGDSFVCKCKGSTFPDRRTKISGTKWEYPIPKSRGYWKKFCDDEEKRLLVVRNHSLKYSYRSFSKRDSRLPNFNTPRNDEPSNLNSLLNYHVDEGKTFENSSHKFAPLRSTCKANEGLRDDTKLFPKAELKCPFRAALKIPYTTRNLATPAKVVRIPKLDTVGPQPSSGGIFPVKVDHVRASFSVQNEPKELGKSTSNDFPTVPMLSEFPTMPGSRSTIKKLLKHLRLPQTRSFPRKSSTFTKNRSESKITGTKSENLVSNRSHEDEEENRKAPTNRDYEKYSARFAYKALKRVTANKNLDFEPKKMEQLLENSLYESKNDTSVNSNENLELLKTKEGKSSEDSEFTRTDIERASLKSEKTTSKTIPSETRFTSGPSLEFVYPESWEGPSTRVLESIPKLSGFPRKNHDRCLACMYKSFEIQPERKISLPRTALSKIISSENTRVASACDSSEDSDSSVSIPNFEDEMQRILNYEETRDVGFDEQQNASESEIVEETASSLQEKYEQAAERMEQKGIVDSEASRKTIAKEAKEDRPDDDATTNNLNDTTKISTQVVSLEGEKVPASFHSESSEEENSIVISIGDERAKPKYLVPCHAPTVFRPSLEHFRALRNRKPTSLQDRIALLESSCLKKSVSVDDYDDAQEKGDKSKTSKEEKSPPPLTKAKSVMEKLTLREAETSARKEQHVLRKVTSLANFPITTEIFRVPSKETSRELDSTRDDDFSKKIFSFPKSKSKLPLTRSDDIAEVLKNLEPNESSTNILEALCKEFSARLSKSIQNSDSKERGETIATLTRLLVDSKRYLYPDKFPSDLLFSANQPLCCNPRILRRILPLKSYNLIAPLLGLPEWYPKKETSFQDVDARRHIDQLLPPDETACKDDSVASLLVHPPTPRDIESTGGGKEKMGQRRYNPYALFLMKPRRKVVTWRPLTKRDLEGYDPDATLKMRADNTMTKICHDFCRWVESLGGTDKTIDEEVLRDMFEIDFDAEACRAMQVSIREMPVVPTEVAITRNTPSASKLAMTRKHVMKDVKAEQMPAKVKAFGTGIPRKLRFVPPNNRVEKNWLQCENVPNDLETMEVVWKDITHLRSVRGFVEWLQQHPEVPPPEALKNIVSMDVEAVRQTEDDEAFAHLELNISQIKSLRVSDSVDGVT